MVASGPASRSALIIAALVTAVGTLPVSYFSTIPYSEKCLCILNHMNVAIEVKPAEVHSCIPYIIGIQSQVGHTKIFCTDRVTHAWAPATLKTLHSGETLVCKCKQGELKSVNPATNLVPWLPAVNASQSAVH